MEHTISIDNIKQAIRNIPDFPAKGIQFKDITTVIKEPSYFKFIVDQLTAKYKNNGITKVVCIESRGFITGGSLAYHLNAGFIPVRKPGKLPAEKYSITYDLEYGQDTLEIHKDALQSDDIVLLHDDLLATGGTSLAAIDLIKKFNVKDVYLNFIIELGFLKGKQRINPFYDVFSLIQY